MNAFLDLSESCLHTVDPEVAKGITLFLHTGIIALAIAQARTFRSSQLVDSPSNRDAIVLSHLKVFILSRTLLALPSL